MSKVVLSPVGPSRRVLSVESETFQTQVRYQDHEVEVSRPVSRPRPESRTTATLLLMMKTYFYTRMKHVTDMSIYSA